jgi:uncharacterized protein
VPEYLSPGVYVEEVDRGPRPIEATGTSTAVFIGYTEKAEETREVDGRMVVNDLMNSPQLVTNWSQYRQKFGGFVDGAYLPLSIYGFFNNGGSRCYVVSVRTIPSATTRLINASGEPALTVRSKLSGVGGLDLRVRVQLSANGSNGAAPSADGEDAAVEESAEENGESKPTPFDLIVEQRSGGDDYMARETLRDIYLEEQELDGKRRVAVKSARNHKSELIDIFVADHSMPLVQLWPQEQQQSLNIDQKKLAAATTTEFRGDVVERTGIEGLEMLDDARIIVVPDLMTTMPGEKLDLQMVKAVQTDMISHCERLGDRVCVLDTPPGLTPQQVKMWRQDVTGFDSSYAAMYYPWIEVMDPATNRTVKMPPSGFVAGVWARTDNTRGVHKAPANEIIQGIMGLETRVTKGEQDTLNPIGVNCIRSFAGMGIRIWGARTLSSNALWRYISVRRLFNMVETSIENATQWTVFEPNDPSLWGKVTRDVGAFLTTIWSSGALYGTSPGQAFYVKCDAETNPPESRDMGRLVVEIGIAPVKPAEFVIFRISQWSPELG